MNYEQRNRVVARCLFAGVIAVLPVQHYVIHRFGEPYPSLIMPSFAGVDTKNGKVQQQSTDVNVEFCGGNDRVLTANEFLYDLPTSHVTAAMDWMFGPRTPNSHPIPRWKRWIFRHVSPAYCKRVLRGEGTSFVDNETRRWISTQIAARYGHRPKSISVSWYADSYDLTTAPPARSRRLLSVVPVALNTCGQ